MTTNTNTADQAERNAFLKRRAEWRANYAELSQNIRMTKLTIKTASRGGEYAAASKAQRKVAILRDYARAAIEERAAMKEESRARYADRQALKAAA